MQNVANRKWIIATETFQEYAMDKLAMIQPLKLQEKNVIQLLINGINSLSIRAAAVIIRADLVDHFLDEVVI